MLASACADSTDAKGASDALVSDRDGAAVGPDARDPLDDAFVLRDARILPDAELGDGLAPDGTAGPADTGAAADLAVTPLDGAPADDAAGDAVIAPDAPVDAAAPPDACPGDGIELCNGVDDDCDGIADEGLMPLWPDMDGDGYGAPRALPTCVAMPGLVANDRDCEDADPLVNPDAEDVPDPDFTDSNCDDLDGDRRTLLFVATDAAPDLQEGSPEFPYATVAQAVDEASRRPDIIGVAVSVGRYGGPLNLVDGVSVYGGYDHAASWRRSTRSPVVLANSAPDRGRIVTVTAENIRTATALDLLVIEADGDPGPGGSIYGIYARNAQGLALRAVTVTTGDAPAGVDGVAGGAGEAGGNGQDGGGCGGPPGAGGASACGATGGAGGAGAPRGSSGAAGGPVGCGGAGGPREGGGAGADGGHGCNPQPMSAGESGNGGDGGTLDPAGYWVTASGATGAPGPNGAPGGGGGGGSGAAVIDGTGGGGAGGGAGGCGGGAGTAGSGGGGSFALFVLDSTGLTVRDSLFQTGSGGRGGNGLEGGPGAMGGNGARGGSGREAFACGGLAGPGAGGNGGRGGTSGRGGHGGGGAGGPSVAVVCSGTTLPIERDTILRPSAGGDGGTSPGLPGAAGASAASQGCEPPPVP